MSKMRFCQVAVGAAMALSSLAANAVVFAPNQLNDIEIINRENNYRSDASCTANGGCLGAGTGPAGFQLVNPGVANNVLVGDIFIGVFATRSIIGLNAGTVWNEDNVAAGGIDTFTGYFAQEVKAIALDVAGTVDRITLGTISVADPFGKLAAGEVAKAWVDTGAGTPWQFDGLGLTLAASIASATDGTVWSSFSVGATPAGIDNDGYVYSELDLGTPGSQLTNGQFYTAWQIATTGPAFNLGTLTGINDPAENVKGGGQVGDPVTTVLQNAAGICAPVLGTYACNDIVGNGQLTANQSGALVLSPWAFASEDPLQLFAVPEPGTLALLGASLLGIAGASRRRRS